MPVTVYTRGAAAGAGQPAVILSYDGHLSMSDPEVVGIAETLADDGYVICVPEHASPKAAGARRITNIKSFYGASSVVGLPPLAMRVWDDLRALQYLAARRDVDQRRIVLVGMGVGGVDAAVTAAIDSRVAALAVVGAITVRDWADAIAPKTNGFDRVFPILPDITTHTDLQYVYSAVAPRPLLLVVGTDAADWPITAEQRVQKTARRLYALYGVSDALHITQGKPRWGIEEIRDWLKARPLGP